MVIEAQTEIGPFMPQNSGGPLNVTKKLAAICSVMMILIQMHSNPIIDVEMNEIVMSIKAAAIQRVVAILLKIMNADAPPA